MISAPKRKLLGILVTFRRPQELSAMLRALASQDRQLDRLIVIDNDPVPDNQEIVRRIYPRSDTVQYVAAPENLGPAGGIALGMDRLLNSADDRDWIVLIDDDDLPFSATLIGDLERFAEAMLARDPLTAAVGRVGARFDRVRGRVLAMSRISDDHVDDAVSVDTIGGGHFPFYLAGAVRKVGPFAAELFFGAEELEYGLRLRKAGFSLYAKTSLWRALRQVDPHIGLDVRPSLSLSNPSWRRYYDLRNLIHIFRTSGYATTALRISLVRGIAKPLANLLVSPRASLKHLAMNLRACRDGWTGRLGRTVEPEEKDRVLEGAPGSR